MKYRVIVNRHPSSLEKDVQTVLDKKEGWDILEAPFYANGKYHQALVSYTFPNESLWDFPMTEEDIVSLTDNG